MRKVFLSIILSLSILFGTTKVAFMTDVTMVNTGHWRCTVLETEQTDVVDTVIIYFHGIGNTGRGFSGLRTLMGKHANDGPTKYATTLTDDWIAPGTVIICPQARDNADFQDHKDEILKLVDQQYEKYPGAKVILAGHSNGAVILFNVACIYGHDVVDGWVFISGESRTSKKLDPSMSNTMVAVGAREQYAKIGLPSRHDFDDLFYTELGDKETAWREEDTNNAYVVGDWSHGETPRLFLEEFFWEWLKDI